ncbi:MAG: beta-propeller domain-containing protein [Clostridia bacterium]|nr:beta-propeller domain-containing protein [Clostridia bacterium]
MDKNENMFNELENAVLNDELPLPESLSEENIKALLDKQPNLKVVKAKKRNRILALITSAAVFCLCLAGVATLVLEHNASTEQLTDVPASGVTQNETVQDLPEFEFMAGNVKYDDILTLAKAYADKNSYEYTYHLYAQDSDSSVKEFFSGIFNGGMKNESADMAVADTTAAANSMVVPEMDVPDAAPMAPVDDAYVDEEAMEDGETTVGTAAGSAKPQYGQTNVQVEGVDEADILKNDGENLYLLKGNTLHVIRAYPADSMAELATVVLKEQFDEEKISYYYANEMFLYNNYLCVMLTCNYSDYSESRTMALIYDISDPANPTFVQRFAQDGQYLSSRIAGGRLILVTTHSDFYTYDYTKNGQQCIVLEDRMIPKTYIGTDDGVSVPESNLSVMDESAPTAFTVVSLFNMDDISQSVSTQAVLGGGTDVYCTNENLFVARRIYEVKEYPSADGLTVSASSYVSTQIYSFTFADGTVQRLATGCVPGEPLNQFSMDEHNGYFRIAVTFGGDNGLYVLDSNLVIVGESEHYGENEQIRSVRFMGDWAYVVTFEQTDPLFVFDLSDPTKPVITGEVKLPGFSAYLHPIGNGLILGLGFGGTESGLDGSAKISLFDVSDPMNPKELDALVHENANLSTDHKAFCTVYDGSFMIPMYSYGTRTDEYGYEIWMQEHGAVLHFAVEDNKLVIRNEYECSELYSNPERVTYIGDTAYAVTCYHTPNVYAFDMASGSLLGTVACSEVRVPYETSGWKHYVETEAETKVKDDGEMIVVMTTPAYNPQVNGVVVGTTAAPAYVPETAVEDTALPYSYDSSVEVAVSDPTKPIA